MTVNQENYLGKIRKLPLTLLLLVSLVCCIGFVALYSASGGNMQPWAYKQIANFCLFLPLAIFIAIIDLRLIYKMSYLFYLIVIALLVGVEIFGSSAMGAKRWMDLGIVRLQPSELAKLAIVLMLARYLHQLRMLEIVKINKILPAVIAVIIPIILIMKEPDLGTAVITIIVGGIIFFAAGLQIWKFAIVGVSALISLPIIWHMMHDYQRRRILVFLDPGKEPLGAGYNIIQSKIAIGSGGLFGKGLTLGTQSHLDFLPEHQTDFIFATLAEEFGFIGGSILLILYSLIIFISLIIAVNSRSIFSKLMVIGITTIFFSHVFINMAMVMGIVPVVGVPLPFVSYGGTMMGSMLMGFGLIMNAQIHQHNNI